MRINKLGEFGLIKRIEKLAGAKTSVIKGIGDDCAVLPCDAKHYLLFTADTLVEGVDFTAKDDLFLVGRKAIGACLSDIAACAGKPEVTLVSLGLPKGFTVNKIDKIYRGINKISREFGVSIAGGDISRAGELFINVSMLGKVEKKNLALRSKARKGDVIFVSGTFGGSFKSKQFTFTPRVKEARFLATNFKINSMIDISDGLLQDLGHIAEESKAGAVIFADLVPKANKSVSLKDALTSGEEFELLFTLSREQAALLLTGQKQRIFSPIGYITGKKQGIKVLDSRNKPLKQSFKGFRHF